MIDEKRILFQCSPRGQGVAHTAKAWKYHAHLLADLVEAQRDEINRLKQKNNSLRQKIERGMSKK